MKSIVHIAFRLLSAGGFLYAAFLMIFSGDIGLFRLIEYYNIPWIASDLVYRILILFLLVSAGTDIFGIKTAFPKFVKLFITVTAWVDFILKYTFFAALHELFYFPDLHFFPVLLILILFSVRTVHSFREENKEPRKKWFVPVLWVVCLGLTFIRPIYIQDWSAPKTIEVPEYFEKTDSIYLEKFGTERAGKPILVAGFTTGCPYCKITAKKMGIAKRNGFLGESLVVFPGSDREKAERFMKKNHTEEVPFMMIDKKLFIALTRGRYPTLYYLSGDKKIHYMRGSTALNGIVLKIIAKDH